MPCWLSHYYHRICTHYKFSLLFTPWSGVNIVFLRLVVVLKKNSKNYYRRNWIRTSFLINCVPTTFRSSDVILNALNMCLWLEISTSTDFAWYSVCEAHATWLISYLYHANPIFYMSSKNIVGFWNQQVTALLKLELWIQFPYECVIWWTKHW